MFKPVWYYEFRPTTAWCSVVFLALYLQRNFVDIIPLSIGVTFDMGLSYGRPRMCVKKPHAYSCSTNKELSSLFFPRGNVGGRSTLPFMHEDPGLDHG